MVSYPSIFFPRYIHMVTFVLKKWPPKARKRWFHGQPAAIKQRIARLSMRTASVFIPRKAKYASLRWRRNGRSRDFLETWTIHDAEQSETWAKPNTIPKVLVYNIFIYITIILYIIFYIPLYNYYLPLYYILYKYYTIILYIIIFYIPLYTIIIYHCIIYYTSIIQLYYILLYFIYHYIQLLSTIVLYIIQLLYNYIIYYYILYTIIYNYYLPLYFILYNYYTIILYIIIFYIPLYTIIIYHCIIYYTIIYIPLYIPLLHGWFMAAPQRDSRWPPRFWPRRWAWRSQKLVPSPVYHKESTKKTTVVPSGKLT